MLGSSLVLDGIQELANVLPSREQVSITDSKGSLQNKQSKVISGKKLQKLAWVDF